VTRSINNLTARTVASLIAGPDGKTADGAGLYLIVTNGRGRWAYCPTVASRKREMGLGAADAVSLAEARAERDKWAAVVRQGLDPIAVRDEQKRKAVSWTFAAEAEIVISGRALKSEKTRDSYKATLGSDYLPASFLAMPIDQIDNAAVIAAVRPIFDRAPAVGRITADRIAIVIDHARAHGRIPFDRPNPARWARNLEFIFQRKGAVEHHAAMPYAAAPAFMVALQGVDTVGSLALQFLILTAVRCGEVLNATWAEIDLDAATWTIPAGRMKAGREHVVPLAPAAIALLKKARPLRRACDDWVFPGRAAKRPVGRRSMWRAMEAAGGDYSLHGFRSTFRDWVGDETSFPREIAEAALAHAVGSAVEQSYRRGSALEKRRLLMLAWADFLAGKKAENVIPMRTA
jgi:integrase